MDPHPTIVYASRKGYFEVVKFLVLSNKSVDYTLAIKESDKNGHFEISEYLRAKLSNPVPFVSTSLFRKVLSKES